jgi:predicted nucleotidyltransferase
MNMDINEKEIEKASREIDLSGFKMKDELNPKIWDEEQKMKPDVRKTLLKIADDYFESLDLPGVDIEDVTMTGSLANYNWSKYSDVDLHIIIDYKDMPMDEELVGDYLLSKSDAWNDKHDIKIYGFDVEIYVQDDDAEHYSSGVYSVLKNEWDIKPEKKKISVKDKAVKDKANRVMDMIDGLYDIMQDTEDYEKVTEMADRIKTKIKKMRQCGLEEGGEWSVENMVFKVLRRNGMYGRLSDIKTVAYDKSMTLESSELNKLTESMSEDPLGWMKEINPTPIEKEEDEPDDYYGLEKEEDEPDDYYGSEYRIVLDYFNEQPVLKEGRWKYSMDSHSGSITWWDEDHEIIFWATPFWDGMEGLPIDYQADMGDYGNVKVIDLPEFKYKEELINWLENEYPEIVLNEIEEFLGDMGPLPD